MRTTLLTFPASLTVFEDKQETISSWDQFRKIPAHCKLMWQLDKKLPHVLYFIVLENMYFIQILFSACLTCSHKNGRQYGLGTRELGTSIIIRNEMAKVEEQNGYTNALHFNRKRSLYLFDNTKSISIASFMFQLILKRYLSRIEMNIWKAVISCPF